MSLTTSNGHANGRVDAAVSTRQLDAQSATDRPTATAGTPPRDRGAAGPRPLDGERLSRARELVATARDWRGALVLLDPEKADGFSVVPYAPKRALFAREGERFEAALRDHASEVLAVLREREREGGDTLAPKGKALTRSQAVRLAVANVLRLARRLPPRDDPSDRAEAARDAFAGLLFAYLKPRPDKGQDPAAARETALAAFVGLAGMLAAKEVALKKFRQVLRGTLGLRPGGRSVHFRAKIGPLMKAAAADAPAHESHTQVLLRLANGVELFHTPDDKLFAVVPLDNRRECHELSSPQFRRWLTHRFYKEMERPPGPDAIASALSVLESRATFDSPERRVSVRVAPGEGPFFYLDLADAEWRAVRVGPDGWLVTHDPPERFRRPRGLLPLPVPMAGEPFGELLRPFVNVAEEDMPLLVAWLTAAILPVGPYPVLVLSGEQATAKSTLAKVLRRLIDPHVSLLRGEPKETRDLMISATNSWVVAYDNLSSLTETLSDSLCRLSTGGGFATRSLFSDTDEVFLDAQRPVILTTIDDLVGRNDLADRCVFLRLPPIADARRRPDSVLWREFEGAWPRLMGGLLTAVSAGLKARDSVRLKHLPRLADFAIWGEAVCRGLGHPPDTFLDRYATNRKAASATLLDGSPLAAAMIDLLVARGAWAGTPKALLEALGRHKPSQAPKWPASAKALASALRRLAPALRDAGYEVLFDQGRDRSIEVRRARAARTSS